MSPHTHAHAHAHADADADADGNPLPKDGTFSLTGGATWSAASKFRKVRTIVAKLLGKGTVAPTHHAAQHGTQS